MPAVILLPSLSGGRLVRGVALLGPVALVAGSRSYGAKRAAAGGPVVGGPVVGGPVVGGPAAGAQDGRGRGQRRSHRRLATVQAELVVVQQAAPARRRWPTGSGRSPARVLRSTCSHATSSPVAFLTGTKESKAFGSFSYRYLPDGTIQPRRRLGRPEHHGRDPAEGLALGRRLQVHRPDALRARRRPPREER